MPKLWSGASVGAYLVTATLNRCLAPRSKAGLAEWFQTTVLRRLMDIEARQLTSQRFWDNMERVSEEAIAAIEAEVVGRAVEAFGLDLSRLLFVGTVQPRPFSMDSNLTESYEWMDRNEGTATFGPAFWDNWSWHDDFMTTLRAVVAHEDVHRWKSPPADFACEM